MMNNRQDKRTEGLHIGVLGGSFDPVHTGHVHLALDALNQVDLDRILVVPAKLQPFKLDRTPASGEDRMEMLRIAFAGEEGIEISPMELDRDGISYTYLTLRETRARYGEEARVSFITGTDSLLKLDTWMNAEELLTEYAYIVGSRPGYLEEELFAKAEELKNRWGTKITIIENRLFDVSSTEIRENVAKGRSIAGMVPEKVEEYIAANQLYV